MNWYVVQVVSGKETQYKRLADSRLSKSTEVEWFFPTRALVERRRGQDKLRNVPLYPGYLFICLQSADPQIFDVLSRQLGFIRFLGSSGQADPLPEQDLELLKVLRSHGDSPGLSTVSFAEDMTIKVISGPLKDLQGRIVKIDKRKQRARVRLDLYAESFDLDFGYKLLGQA